MNTQTPKRFPLLLVVLYLAYLDKHQGLEDELNSGNWTQAKQTVMDTVQRRIDDLRDRIPFNLRADALYTFWYNCSNKVQVEQ